MHEELSAPYTAHFAFSLALNDPGKSVGNVEMSLEIMCYDYLRETELSHDWENSFMSHEETGDTVTS